MTARLISIAGRGEEAIAAAVDALSRREPVAIPTETVYGLAADATEPEAIARIYEAKGRPRFNPLICHMADLDMARDHAVFDPLSERLANAFWPGPLTLVLPLKTESAIHALATAGLDTVGLRVPLGLARELIHAFGRPLAAPSANISGAISPTTAAHVAADLGERIDLVLDGGPSSVGVESTIVKVEDGVVRMLRPGGITAEEIERVAGRPVLRADKAGAAIEAPGMLASHYAPRASVRLNAAFPLPGEAYIAFGPMAVEQADKAAFLFNLSQSADLREAAGHLFAAMKRADESGAAAIAVAPIPAHDLGEAINDRLERAAAPRG